MDYRINVEIDYSVESGAKIHVDSSRKSVDLHHRRLFDVCHWVLAPLPLRSPPMSLCYTGDPTHYVPRAAS